MELSSASVVVVAGAVVVVAGAAVVDAGAVVVITRLLPLAPNEP